MLIEGIDLKMEYKVSEFSKEKKVAIEDINISLKEGKTLAIVGSSGSGKTTIGHILGGMIKPSNGRIIFDGNEISHPYKGMVRKNIQVVFQHPELSFNPKITIEKSILETYKMAYKGKYKEKILEDIMIFGLSQEHLKRLPSQLSGGELQRATLMRILSVKPRLLILDEVTSMLDVISQAQIIDLLKVYQEENKVAYIFITHNEILAQCFADKIIRLEDGKVTQVLDEEYLKY